MSNGGTELELDTGPLEAVKAHKDCTAHSNMVRAIKMLNSRLRRIERMGMILLGLSAGILGRDVLVPILLKWFS